MSYRIQRISLGSALRLGLLLGWMVALLPAFGGAWLAVEALGLIGALLAQMTPYEFSIFGQAIASLDPLLLLGLEEAAGTVSSLSAQASLIFWLLTAGLTLLGGLGVALMTLLMALVYNLLASLGGGLKLELRETA
ncbi:MAG: hypothetical protein AB4911_22150 [Oscillochloridaceae bacterium umkhey_bin13]